MFREGARPELIIEVTSPATRNNDLNKKPDIYWRARVPYYVIVDATLDQDQRQLNIIGYKRGPRRYRQMPLDAQGRLWLEPVRLWLGQENGWVVCYDEQGRRQENYTEACESRQAAEERAGAAEERAEALAERAEALAERAEAAERRLQGMEAELRRLRGEK